MKQILQQTLKIIMMVVVVVVVVVVLVVVVVMLIISMIISIKAIIISREEKLQCGQVKSILLLLLSIYIYICIIYIYILFFSSNISYFIDHLIHLFFLPDLRNQYIDLFIYLLPFMIYNRECWCYEFRLSYMATCQCSGSSIMGTRSNFPITIILSIS